MTQDDFYNCDTKWRIVRTIEWHLKKKKKNHKIINKKKLTTLQNNKIH